MIRTRFAPSPTGFLHRWSAHGFILLVICSQDERNIYSPNRRYDLERSTPESVQAILDGMAWLGLSHDEALFIKRNDFPRYQAVIEQMLEARQLIVVIVHKNA